jgi:CelD/BcsL family acetyltransferase involved in cellulose biosynthesis
MKTVIVNTITANADFSILENEWKDLMHNSKSSNVFLTWEWISSWWDCFSEGRELWILTARTADDGKLVGLAPFNIKWRFLRNIFPYRELSFMENQRAAPDHLDIISRTEFEEDVTSVFVDFIMENRFRWDILRLNHVDSASLFLSRIVQRKSPDSALWSQPCPYISLPENWEDFLSGLSKNARHNILRYGNRLKKDHADQVSYLKIDKEDELLKTIDIFSHLHLDRKSEQKLTSTLSDPHQLKFLQQVTNKFNYNGWLHFYLLLVKEQPVAAVICFFYKGIFSFYQQGHDPAWAVYSPGRQITAYSVQRAIESGAHEFDFLRGDETYKYTWTKKSHDDIEFTMTTSRWGRFIFRMSSIAQKIRTLNH